MSHGNKDPHDAFQHMVTKQASEHILVSAEQTMRQTLDEMQPFGGVCKHCFSYDMTTGLLALALRLLCESEVSDKSVHAIFTRITDNLPGLLTECRAHIAKLKAKAKEETYYHAMDLDDDGFESDEVKSKIIAEVDELLARMMMKGGK
jgi:hypothetical protein